ncbi:HAD family hydrolase [Actinoplanes sp. DH11]|uniref:HAD family hydrolase n=1 Tax=Actinoplanes sp. DH11 TaxID=2857011 RepID=UPI001E2FE465|nr:HAD family hydrolase [Actinoplanes sp. DH11]
MIGQRPQPHDGVAVVFDFFGTLTDPAAEADRRPAFDETAAVLGIPGDDFYAAMADSFPQRIVGACGSTRDTLLAMARACGTEPAPSTLDAAVRTHHAGAERVRRPRAGGLATLAALRGSGFRVGLLSDCSSELCEAWAGTPYAPLIDAPVFSWREGRRKPDPHLYATVAARLGVPPTRCWYVGDGGSREHQGAAAAGMHPILITNAGHPGAAVFRNDPDPFLPACQRFLKSDPLRVRES